ncbi:hypothetical protein LQZ18_03955 [Lachnospiraceae bacterium ZAX-1]
MIDWVFLFWFTYFEMPILFILSFKSSIATSGRVKGSLLKEFGYPLTISMVRM